jgi:hypothetical protein
MPALALLSESLGMPTFWAIARDPDVRSEQLTHLSNGRDTGKCHR